MRRGVLSALISVCAIASLAWFPFLASPQSAYDVVPTPLPPCGVTASVVSPPLAASPRVDLSTSVAGGSGVLRQLADVPLPGDTSRFDYQSFDPVSGRLYISHMDAGQLVVFDTTTQAVTGTVDDLPTVTGVLVVPELHRVFAAVAGDHQVAVIDTQDLRVIARLGTIGFPDGLAYAPQAKQVFVSDESGGGEVVIDAVTNQVVTSIDIGGDAGNTQYDPGSGCIMVAVQSRNQLVVIDPTTDQVVGNYDVGHR